MNDPIDRSEIDQSRLSGAHTLGLGENQAMPGGILSDQTITGSRSAGIALGSVIAILVHMGAVDESTF